MGYFRERFGLKEVLLSREEKADLQLELQKIDEQRIDFFALMNVFICSLFLVFDVLIFNDEAQYLYLFLILYY
jgi:hypothetical protein